MLNYSSLPQELDLMLRMRDKALIALAWTFFKRGGENLKVRIGDVFVSEDDLSVTFYVEKKRKKTKLCSSCGTRNRLSAQFCAKCGLDIRALILVEVGNRETLTVTKSKVLNYRFCKFILDWLAKIRLEIKRNSDDFLFPRYHYFSKNFLWHKHLTIQRFDQILQRLDPTMTSHMFRYGATEKFLRIGYSPFDLKEMGDWSTTTMPELYARRKGLTPSQKKFAQDTRMT